MNLVDLRVPKVLRSPLWAGVRRAHLRQNPTCACCGTYEHCEVHHIKPVHIAPELELEPKNLVTLCASPSHNCHLWIGHLGSWLSWNTTVIRDASRMLSRIRTRPMPGSEVVLDPATAADNPEEKRAMRSPAKADRPYRPTAVHFGIDDYRGTQNDLSVCVADANALADLFHGRIYTNGRVTSQLFLTAVGLLVQAVPAWRGPTDYGILTYSGHGTYLPDDNRDEPDGRDECLVMANLEPLRDDAVRRALAPRKPEARLILITDSCFSGTVFRLLQQPGDPHRVRFMPPGNLGQSRPHLRAQASPKQPPLAGVVHISACSDFEFAYEGEGNGVLTGALVEAYDRNLTIGGWFAAAEKIVKASGYPQTPQINCHASALDWPVPVL